MKKRALIIGISGQVGSIMANFLLKKKYIIFGVSRKKKNLDLSNLVKLKINDDIKVVSLDVENYKDLSRLINSIKPHEIYQFSGVSSIRRAQIQPLKTLKYILNITYNLLQICKKKKNIRIYFAGTGQIFDFQNKKISEDSKVFPRNIYSYAKNISLNLVSRYRHLHGLKVCTGITFNHESYNRPEDFVTMKIIKDALRVKNLKKNKVLLHGNVNSYCDWGWAPEYVEAMWKMLQGKKFNDYVIATGKTYSVYDFIKIIFKKLKLDLKKNLKVRFKDYGIDKKFIVSTKKINREMKWKAKTYMKKIAILMLKNQYERIN